MKMDKYPLEDQDQAFDEVYNSKDEMQSFMVGLALSQYLWGTHYEMFRHFTEGLQNNKKRIKSYLEIGPGHGLFFKKAIETIGNNCKYTAVDISSTSLNLTESIVSFFQLSNNNINFFNEDMLSIDTKELYDFIVMGEVLEQPFFSRADTFSEMQHRYLRVFDCQSRVTSDQWIRRQQL